MHSMTILWVFVGAVFTHRAAGESLYPSCMAILRADPKAPSGEYSIITSTWKILIKVYCEMGLNGGGYTFIHPSDLPRLTNDELQALFTDKSSILIRAQLSNKTQPYGVLEQLPEYRNIPLTVQLGNSEGFTPPANLPYIRDVYLFYGFLPASFIQAENAQPGLQVNGNSITFPNCEGGENSYIALFPNFHETTYSKWGFTVADNPPLLNYISITEALLQNPSRRLMPEDYFIFLETHFGGCEEFLQFDEQACSQNWGTTEQTRGENVCFISASIGVR